LIPRFSWTTTASYLYFGNPNAWYVKLNKDMTSYSGEVVKADGKPRNYQEGPWFYKRNGHYYLAYAPPVVRKASVTP